MQKVKLFVDGQLAYITINRPEQLNCFDYETLIQLQEIVEEIKLRKKPPCESSLPVLVKRHLVPELT